MWHDKIIAYDILMPLVIITQHEDIYFNAPLLMFWKFV